MDAVIDALWGMPRGESSFVTAIIPEVFRAPVAARRPFATDRVLAEVPPAEGARRGDHATSPCSHGSTREWRPPTRAVCRVLVSGAHAASMRAVNYAGALGLDDTRAVFFAIDHEEADRMRSEWAGRPMRLPLEVEEAHYRDLGDPLLRTCAASPRSRAP